MNDQALSAALTLSLTGRYRRQGQDAADGVRLWADRTGVDLTIVDDKGSVEIAVAAYTQWASMVDLLLSPYSSGLVRAIAPVVRNAGQILWNHGGSADDLYQPGVASLPAPASSYFTGTIHEVAARGIQRIVIVRGPGPFARAVTDGAQRTAHAYHIDTVTAASIADLANVSLRDAAVVTAGSFEHDTEVIRQLQAGQHIPALTAAVAAGIAAFSEELGDRADGILGPVQWWPTSNIPDHGPAGIDFTGTFATRTGRSPSYVAAQAASAGYLAQAAHQRHLTAGDLPGWTTSTTLGSFELDTNWHQIGHTPVTIQWRRGRMHVLRAPD